LDFYAGRPVAIIDEKISKKLNVRVNRRAIIKNLRNNKSIIAVVDIAYCKNKNSCLFGNQKIVLSKEIFDILDIKDKDKVEILPALEPMSINYIRERMEGKKLPMEKINAIINDIVSNNLTESEVAYFLSANYFLDKSEGIDKEYVLQLTKALINTGSKLDLNHKFVLDKHSIGGIAGNRTTPLVVSIVTAATDILEMDAVFPKTSSKAITSAAGTVDTLETVTKIELDDKEIKKILEKAHAFLIWNGSINLSPGDDKIINVEKIVSINPVSQLVASIMSKKVAASSTHLLVDISYGESAKVDKEGALELKELFEFVAKKFNIKLKVVFTDGSQPVGNGIGPVLEMRDLLAVLTRQKNRPMDLEDKSLFLAGQLLELTGKIPKNKGFNYAKVILNSGLALKKFIEIIEAQNNKKINLNELEKKLVLDKSKKDIISNKDGIIKKIDNKGINLLARIAGSPVDLKAGIYLWKHKGQKIKKGEKIFTIFTESKNNLTNAVKLYKEIRPIEIN